MNVQYHFHFFTVWHERKYYTLFILTLIFIGLLPEKYYQSFMFCLKCYVAFVLVYGRHFSVKLLAYGLWKADFDQTAADTSVNSWVGSSSISLPQEECVIVLLLSTRVRLVVGRDRVKEFFLAHFPFFLLCVCVCVCVHTQT